MTSPKLSRNPHWQLSFSSSSEKIQNEDSPNDKTSTVRKKSLEKMDKYNHGSSSSFTWEKQPLQPLLVIPKDSIPSNFFRSLVPLEMKRVCIEKKS